MQGASTPEREQCELTRVVAPFDGDRTNGSHHRRTSESSDPQCSFHWLKVKSACKLIHRCFGQVAPYGHLPVEEGFSTEASEQHISVSHCCVFAALVVAGGPGHSPGAV